MRSANGSRAAGLGNQKRERLAMSRKKISTTIYVTPEQSDRLKLLHDRTKVPVAVYIREGIDLVLNHYGHLLPGQLQLDGRAAGPSRAAADPADAQDEGDSDLAPKAALSGQTSHGHAHAAAAAKK
jgi:hypothetical protein